MKNILKKTGLALALAATSLAAASPASARDDYYDRGNNDAAVAIGAGILGLVVGAAIASDNDDRRYDERHYYQNRRYYPQNYRYDNRRYDNRRYDNRRHDRYREYRQNRNHRSDHYRGRRGYYGY